MVDWTARSPLHDLSGMGWERVDDLLRRKVVHGERMTVIYYDFRAGGSFPAHRHAQEQITYVLDGTVTFVLDDDEYVIGAGSLIVIPPGVVHAAWVDEPASALSIVAPSRREDAGIRYERAGSIRED